MKKLYKIIINGKTSNVKENRSTKFYKDFYLLKQLCKYGYNTTQVGKLPIKAKEEKMKIFYFFPHPRIKVPHLGYFLILTFSKN